MFAAVLLTSSSASATGSLLKKDSVKTSELCRPSSKRWTKSGSEGGFSKGQYQQFSISQGKAKYTAGRRDGAFVGRNFATARKTFAVDIRAMASVPGADEAVHVDVDVDVAIVGGGPGGLTAACAIRKTRPDLSVAVFERAEKLGRLGSVVAIQNNGLAALEAIDPAILAAVQSLVSDFKYRIMCDLSGNIIQKRPPFSSPSTSSPHLRSGLVVWYQLQRALAGALPPEAIQLGWAFDSLQQEEDHVRLNFAGGRTVRAKVAIGADGSQSGVRKEILNDGPPKFADTAIWRGHCRKPDDWEREEGRVIKNFFDKQKIGTSFSMYDLTEEDRLTWQAFAPWPADRLDELASRRYYGDVKSPSMTSIQRCLSVYAEAGFPKLVTDVIQSTPPEQLTEHGQFFREADSCQSWVRSRVALLGDAAHLMTPLLGQGINQALEDAVELGRHIGELGPTAAALLQYEKTRLPLVEVVHRGSVDLAKEMWLHNKPPNEYPWYEKHPEVIGRRPIPLTQLRQVATY